MIEEYVVKINTPAGVGRPEMREYIAVAIRQWAKGGYSDHPLFDLTEDDIEVKNLRVSK